MNQSTSIDSSAAASLSGDAVALESSGLTKRFGQHTAVDGVDLHVPRGAVYGFLGPNGSGKTTTIRMLLGLISPTVGSSRLLGQERTLSALPRVGALVEGPAFHPYLSGRANLRRLDAADKYSDPRTSAARIEAALERVGLAAAAKKRYRAYSLGMKQRLGLASALLQPRELLVLDEPTNGLDPQGTREIRTLVAELAADGTTVFISSHLLSEVEQMCTHIGVMSRGKLIAQETVAQLRARGALTCRLRTDDPVATGRVLNELGLTLQQHDSSWTSGPVASDEYVFDPGDVAVEKIVAALVHAGVGVRGVDLRRPTLEEQFVILTGEGFDVSG